MKPIMISFGIDGYSKVRMYAWVCMVSSFRQIVTLVYSFIPCFLKAISISSSVASDSSLLLTMCNILTFDQAVNQETGASGQRYRNITLTCEQVEFSANAMPTGSRWTSNNYITRCHRRFESVGIAEFSSSCSHSSSCSWGQDAVVRASARQRAWALRTPVEQPSRMRKKYCYGQRNLGSICGSLFRHQLTSHT